MDAHSFLLPQFLTEKDVPEENRKYSFPSPSALQIGVLHNLSRHSYGRKPLCKCVCIYYRRSNTGIMLKIFRITRFFGRISSARILKNITQELTSITKLEIGVNSL
jgi:hypothetical protein